ncbi:hypothetical protein DCO58_03780 [Helicobacter saguini]|uniref:Uncharacterized protein n=1 Tax=Helicobacter saguini TaxID=1548018 RepID=A0A347VSG7_9HELI|nr:hypothetical protein [Helicobacter saguini]MWV62516.1 hypothetical protein [Helicobacter saguini]MWV66810.1 hypothetical protein [Helicobacter saguini]MWV69161.1 hypothetical protein [Helicobacter saguini]MWV71284.1 hypothetical protein [Helicobacter saguini]TLD94203.1 hypothetical protein LS64_006800 [Helicobacter saguini]
MAFPFLKILSTAAAALPLIPKIIKGVKATFDTIKETFFSDNKKHKQNVIEIENKVIESKPIDVKTAKLIEISDINNILNEYKNKEIQGAKELENSLINMFQTQINIVIESLNNHINTSKLKRLKSEIHTHLQGHITKFISSEISLNNKECAKILNIVDNHTRSISMRKFINKKYIESIKIIKDKYSQILHNLSQNIKDSIESNINMQKTRLNFALNTLNNTSNISNIKQKQTAQLHLAKTMFIESNTLFNICDNS